MKMRFVFVLSLVSFLNPVSVLAAGEKFDVSRTHKKCGKPGLKMLPEDTVRGLASSAPRRATTAKGGKALNSSSRF